MIENVELNDLRLITRLLGNSLIHSGKRWLIATMNVTNITMHSKTYQYCICANHVTMYSHANISFIFTAIQYDYHIQLLIAFAFNFVQCK